MDNLERALKVKIIIMDVDGTLTDGTLTVLPDGEELKSYHVKDGLGIILARQAGFKTGIISGKTSKALEVRARKLQIEEVHQGILDKKKKLLEILEKHDLTTDEVAYIGDDIGDLEVINISGFSAAVSDAHPLVKKQCHFICNYRGGKGAVREFIEFILGAQDKWTDIMTKTSNLTDLKIKS